MQLLISELEQTHPHYDPVVSNSNGVELRALETYSNFHSGGRHFEKNKDRYLRRRPIDMQPGGSNHRNAKLSCAYYTPHAGGIGDNMCGTALQYPPTISVASAVNAKNAEKIKYWLDLNQSIDGKRSDARSLGWALLNQLIIHKRAYLVVNFPTGKDATFTSLCAKDVDDWQLDEDGNYEWIRTHCVDLIRSKGDYAPQDTEQHTWTFYTDEDTTEYTAKRKIGEGWPEKALATAGTPMPHGLGELPIFPIEVEDNFWVMDRLFSTAHAYFNREASRAFAIDTGAMALPIVKTNKDLNSLVTSNGVAIKLGLDDDFLWRSPDSGIYGALKDDCDYLLGNLYSALNQMALAAAGQSGNPRQSGTAKTADGASIKAFLSLLCAPVMTAFRNAVKAVQKYRDEEDLEIEVHGMTAFDVQSIELEINRCSTFCMIPNAPAEAKAQSVLKAVRAYMPDISQEAKDKIQQQLDEMPEVEAAPAGAPGITNATTGRPQGFAPGQVSQKFTKAAITQQKQVSQTVA